MYACIPVLLHVSVRLSARESLVRVSHVIIIYRILLYKENKVSCKQYSLLLKTMRVIESVISLYATLLRSMCAHACTCIWTTPAFILDVIKYCDHPRWYEKIPPGGGTSDQRWDLQSEVAYACGATQGHPCYM